MNIEDLKKEANSLGISYSPNIGAAKLAERIEEYYTSQETDTVEAAVAAVQEAQQKAKEPVKKNAQGLTPDQLIRAIARENEKKARKMRIVTINDTDNRINNHATTCVSNCGNQFFDLGTVILPLNIKVQVAQGHIDTLRAVRIPHHVVDPRDSSRTITVLRPRYTIQYEDVK